MEKKSFPRLTHSSNRIFRARSLPRFKVFSGRKKRLNSASRPIDTPRDGNHHQRGSIWIEVMKKLGPHCSWYPGWLESQIASIPTEFVTLFELSLEHKSGDYEKGEIFLDLLGWVEKFAKSPPGASLDDIIHQLVSHGHLRKASDMESFGLQRKLIFAILGWQSMLFLPSFGSTLDHQLAIQRTPDEPGSGLIFDNYAVEDTLADRPLAILLKAFGNLLPSRGHSQDGLASEFAKKVHSWSSFTPADINAYLLHKLLRVNIRWVDTMVHHLDYDKSTKSLSLYRFPSFSLAMLESRGTTYSFASIESQAIDPRATDEEITDFLQETILSYRLLFGQSKPARRFFWNIWRSRIYSCSVSDGLLRTICTEENFAHPLVPPDREVYVTIRDFPVLGERIEYLAAELRAMKPRSWGDILRDRRDGVQYWTFWLVAIFGGIGLMLSMAQVVLNSIQVAQSAPP